MSEPARKPITLDEALAIVTDIARNGDGAERFRALKLVMAQEASTATLPEPFTDAEVIDRLARMIRAAGPTASQMAYRKAFPAAKRPIHHAAPKVTEADITPIDKAMLPTTLRGLYKMFPEAKRAGTPRGYPVHGGMAVQKEWVQKMAIRMTLDAEQKKLDQIATQAAEAPSEEQVDAAE